MHRTSSHSVRHDAPPREQVVAAAREWVAGLRRAHPEIVRAGYFGSYARGDYVPGSDFDVMIEVSGAREPRRADRAGRYLPPGFPVGIDLFVYATDELARLRDAGDAFVKMIDREISWLN